MQWQVTDFYGIIALKGYTNNYKLQNICMTIIYLMEMSKEIFLVKYAGIYFNIKNTETRMLQLSHIATHVLSCENGLCLRAPRIVAPRFYNLSICNYQRSMQI